MATAVILACLPPRACASQVCCTWEWNMDVDTVPSGSWNSGMELERANGYSGARGGFYETLNCYTMTLCHARNSRLPSTVVPRYAPSAMLSGAQQPALSLTLCSPLRSPCLLRSFSDAVNVPLLHPRGLHRSASTQPLSSLRVRTVAAARSNGEPATAMDCDGLRWIVRWIARWIAGWIARWIARWIEMDCEMDCEMD